MHTNAIRDTVHRHNIAPRSGNVHQARRFILDIDISGCYFLSRLPKNTHTEVALSRRERQIMDVLFALQRATGQEIQQRLPDAPNYSTVRTILRVLERKGHVRHVEEGLRYVYLPVMQRETARKSAIERLLATFFEGSAKAAVAAFIEPGMSKEDLRELERMIRKARKEKAQ